MWKWKINNRRNESRFPLDMCPLFVMFAQIRVTGTRRKFWISKWDRDGVFFSLSPVFSVGCNQFFLKFHFLRPCPLFLPSVSWRAWDSGVGQGFLSQRPSSSSVGAPCRERGAQAVWTGPSGCGVQAMFSVCFYWWWSRNVCLPTGLKLG